MTTPKFKVGDEVVPHGWCSSDTSTYRVEALRGPFMGSGDREVYRTMPRYVIKKPSNPGWGEVIVWEDQLRLHGSTPEITLKPPRKPVDVTSMLGYRAVLDGRLAKAKAERDLWDTILGAVTLLEAQGYEVFEKEPQSP
jgi:hypothetical protein